MNCLVLPGERRLFLVGFEHLLDLLVIAFDHRLLVIVVFLVRGSPLLGHHVFLQFLVVLSAVALAVAARTQAANALPSLVVKVLRVQLDQLIQILPNQAVVLLVDLLLESIRVACYFRCIGASLLGFI